MGSKLLLGNEEGPDMPDEYPAGEYRGDRVDPEEEEADGRWS